MDLRVDSNGGSEYPGLRSFSRVWARKGPDLVELFRASGYLDEEEGKAYVAYPRGMGVSTNKASLLLYPGNFSSKPLSLSFVALACVVNSHKKRGCVAR